MDAPRGSFVIGPETGALTVHTGRSGLGAAAGHDLIIEVTRWQGKVNVDGSVSSATVEVVVDATSLEVREGLGGAVPLLPINKADIARTIKRLLRVKKYPEMRFSSTSVSATDDGYLVRGDLTIADKTRSVELTVAVDGKTNPPGGTVTTTVKHSDFGITPYSAMLGVLRVRDEVEVRALVRPALS